MAATLHTTPLHIWLHNLMMEAHASAEQLGPYRERMVRAYNAGEPVWMAADELKLRLRQRAIEEQADAEAAGLRRRLAGALPKDGGADE
jgi:hypothetical protein